MFEGREDNGPADTRQVDEQREREKNESVSGTSRQQPHRRPPSQRLHSALRSREEGASDTDGKEMMIERGVEVR